MPSFQTIAAALPMMSCFCPVATRPRPCHGTLDSGAGSAHSYSDCTARTPPRCCPQVVQRLTPPAPRGGSSRPWRFDCVSLSNRRSRGMIAAQLGCPQSSRLLHQREATAALRLRLGASHQPLLPLGAQGICAEPIEPAQSERLALAVHAQPLSKFGPHCNRRAGLAVRVYSTSGDLGV